jgi:hypothetical protein
MSEISMQQLKEQRMSPAEKFVLDTIKGVKPGEPDKDGYVYWCKDGNWLFIQYFKYSFLMVHYSSIWISLGKEYKLNYNEIQELINNVMYKYTNSGQLKPAPARLGKSRKDV